MENISTSLKSIIYNKDSLKILDQLALPVNFIYEDASTTQAAFFAIKSMKVRGAPLIAITAALSIACELKNKKFNFDINNDFFFYPLFQSI